MAKFLVRGRLKPARKQELASRLKDGTLAQGAPFQTELLAALHQGHAVEDDVYVTLDASEDVLEREQRILEGYLDVVQVVPVDDVSAQDLSTIRSYPPLPEWAGLWNG